MLSTPYEAFGGLARRTAPRLPDFDALARQKAAWIGRELDPRSPGARHEATQAALGRLRRRPRRGGARRARRDRRRPGRVVQRRRPARALHLLGRHGGEPAAARREDGALAPPAAYWGFYGDGTNRTFPVDAALGRHLVETLTRDHEFDVAHLRVQPRHGPFGHAWSFVHQRLMGDRVVPIVPVLLNTYYPPNQPTPQSVLCSSAGPSVQAIEALADPPSAWGSSHPADSAISSSTRRSTATSSRSLAKKDGAALGALPLAQLDSGNSEIRNWIATAGAVEHLHDATRGLRAELPVRGRLRRGHGLRGLAIGKEESPCSRAKTTSCCAGSDAERRWASCCATTGCRACPRASCPRPTARRRRCACSARDLVAFRDTRGEVGLLAANCPHRGASLFFGRNEECGLRCSYHGWKYDVTGRCVDMPNEPEESTFKDKIRARAYPCRDVNGVIWTYMGPRETRAALPGLRDQHAARRAGLPAAHDAGGVQLGAGARGRHRLLPHRLRARQALARRASSAARSTGTSGPGSRCCPPTTARATRRGGAPTPRACTGTASPSSSCPSTR